ncbi:MAG: dihydrofolate reductase family protein, partial [Myxococcota bacterium]
TSISMDADATPAHLSRVEVEISSGAPEPLAPMVEALRRSCDLRTTTVSKLETGLLAHGLVDLFRLWTFPVIVGSGKRLFGENSAPAGLTLLKTEPCPSGAVMNLYRKLG